MTKLCTFFSFFKQYYDSQTENFTQKNLKCFVDPLLFYSNISINYGLNNVMDVFQTFIDLFKTINV